MRLSSLFKFPSNVSHLQLRKTDDWDMRTGDINFRMRMGDVMIRMKWQGTVSGLLIGMGVGIAIGMLFAPKSGKDTRDQIVGTVKDGLDGAIAKGQDLTRRVQQTLDDAREHVKDAAEAGERAYRDARSTVS
jgi:gas vesicle protein